MYFKKYYFLASPIFFLIAISIQIILYKTEKYSFYNDFKLKLSKIDIATLDKYKLDSNSTVDCFIEKINEINKDYKLQENEIKINQNRKRKISKTLIIKLNILLQDINNKILLKQKNT